MRIRLHLAQVKSGERLLRPRCCGELTRLVVAVTVDMLARLGRDGDQGVTVIVALVASRTHPLFRKSRRLYVPGVPGIATGNDVWVMPPPGGVCVPLKYRQL